MIKIQNLEIGKRYLRRRRYYKSDLDAITILELADQGIKVRYDNGNTHWYTPFDLSGDNYAEYEILEELKALDKL